MKRNDLDHAFDTTPHVFTDRVDAVLHMLKEDEPVKKFTLRTAMVALLYTMLLCSIACAVVFTQGQEWYYNNRFNAYKENEPMMQQEIFEHLETEVLQEPSEDSKGLVDVTVQDYAWVPSQNLLTISLAARAKDNGTYELHPMMAMDPDGYWMPTLDPNDKESRTEHWLSTVKGLGLPADVMNDPDKTLLLADMGSQNILIGDSDVPLYTRSFDSFTGDNGAVIAVMEIDLKQLDADYLRQCHDALASSKSTESSYLYLGDSGETVVKLQEALAEKGHYHGDINGLYGEGVRLAVMAFQKANKLFSDGVAGPVTQGSLFGYYAVPANSGTNGESQTTAASNVSLCLHLGDSGEAVVKLQEALAEQGYYNGEINGLYGEGVRLAVMSFQEANKLFSDGVAGPATQFMIYGYEDEEDIMKALLDQETDIMKVYEENLLDIIHSNNANAAIEKYTDAEGMLSLRLPYQIVPFENGNYGKPTNGVAVFKVKIR